MLNKKYILARKQKPKSVNASWTIEKDSRTIEQKESKTNKDNIYQKIMHQKDEMLQKETQYETKKEWINQRLSNLKSKTINLRPTSSSSAIKSEVTDNPIKIKGNNKTISQEKLPFQSKPYFHYNNINTKHFRQDNINNTY